MYFTIYITRKWHTHTSGMKHDLSHYSSEWKRSTYGVELINWYRRSPFVHSNLQRRFSPIFALAANEMRRNVLNQFEQQPIDLQLLYLSLSHSFSPLSRLYTHGIALSLNIHARQLIYLLRCIRAARHCSCYFTATMCCWLIFFSLVCELQFYFFSLYLLS